MDPLHLGELSTQVARLSERVDAVRTDIRELRTDIEKTADKLQVVEARYERIVNRVLGASGFVAVLWVVIEKFLPG